MWLDWEFYFRKEIFVILFLGWSVGFLVLILEFRFVVFIVNGVFLSVL